MHREPGQFLERLEHFTAAADELVERGADDGYDGPFSLNVHVDVSVEVSDIEKAFDVVGSDLALELQVGNRRSLALADGLVAFAWLAARLLLDAILIEPAAGGSNRRGRRANAYQSVCCETAVASGASRA
jgi:hypothetical protein